jgi:tRNA nucleotidyltransferase (CCA-adding enzyme)
MPEIFAPLQNPLRDKAELIARAARENGGRALLVGGYVRDELLGLAPKDADVEVYGIEAGALRVLLEKLGRVNCVGESFRVYKLAWWQKFEGQKQRFELDVSIPRRDRKVGMGHRGFEIEGDPNASIEEAARRRDFTINAILLDPLTSEVLDPFGGQADLQNRVLRAVDETHFAEDSLRVLRACQFAARFELSIEERTVEICRAIELSDLPRERVWNEWEKLLMKSQKPSIGLRVAWQLDVLEKLFPYLATAMIRRGTELLSTLDNAAHCKANLTYPRQVTLMLASIGAYLGRGEFERWLEALGVFSMDGYDVRRNAIVLAGERKRARDWYLGKDKIEDREFRYLSARIEPRMVYQLARARGDEEAAAWFWDKVSTLGVAEGPPTPLLMGRDLLEMGMAPGKQVGEILQTVYARQLAGEIQTHQEARAAARGLMPSADD